MSESTLADDEATLAAHAQLLAAAVDSVVGEWIRRSIMLRAPHLADSPETAAIIETAVEAGSADVSRALGALLAIDVDAQTEGPLQVLRRGVRWASQVLTAAGIAPAKRDEFSTRAFPEDVFDLAPASFADVDPSLREPGLVWGAAKAHLHLRRRRESSC